jgi:hypothetical protein
VLKPRLKKYSAELADGHDCRLLLEQIGARFPDTHIVSIDDARASLQSNKMIYQRSLIGSIILIETYVAELGSCLINTKVSERISASRTFHGVC